MSNYLLIWHEFPEAIRYFSIPEEEYKANWHTLRQAHNTMVNDSTVNDEYAAKILGYITTGVTKMSGQSIQTMFDGKWVEFEIDVSSLPDYEFKGVFFSGILL